MGSLLEGITEPGLLSGSQLQAWACSHAPTQEGPLGSRSSWIQDLVALKTNGVKQWLNGDVIWCLDRRDFRLVEMKMLQAPESLPSTTVTCKESPYTQPLSSTWALVNGIHGLGRPQCGLLFKGHDRMDTASAEAALTPSRKISAGTSSMPVIPGAGAEGDPLLCFQSSEQVCWVDKGHQGNIHPAWALRLPSATPAATQDQLPLSTRTWAHTPRDCPSVPDHLPISTFCPTPVQRGWATKLYVPFSILSQQEIEPNPFCTRVPDNCWGVSQNVCCDLPSPKAVGDIKFTVLCIGVHRLLWYLPSLK